MNATHGSPGEIVSVGKPMGIADALDLAERGLVLHVPAHWWPTPSINEHAVRVEMEALSWFVELGFGDRAIRILESFSVAQYAGRPFPLAGHDELLLIAKYLSLWLLWDDVDVERKERGFRVRAANILATGVPHGTTLFDKAFVCLFRELAETMSLGFLDALAGAMDVWSDAALRQAQSSKRQRPGAPSISFSEAMRLRIDTIGMYGTAYLIEYMMGCELPKSFHEHEAVRELERLAGEIVGLGNDIFSLGKDWASCYVNVILVLQKEQSLSLLDALRRILRRHDEALLLFDEAARALPSFGEPQDARVAAWLQHLRHACLGFTVWESRAPRYTALELRVNGARVMPGFARGLRDRDARVE